jgi:hypothetical protein
LASVKGFPGFTVAAFVQHVRHVGVSSSQQRVRCQPPLSTGSYWMLRAGSEHFLGAGTYKPSPVERINSVFHFPFSIHFPFEEPQKRRKGRHFLRF